MNKLFCKLYFSNGNKLVIPSENVLIRNHKIYISNNKGSVLITDFNHVEFIEMIEESNLINVLPGLELSLDRGIEELSV